MAEKQRHPRLRVQGRARYRAPSIDRETALSRVRRSSRPLDVQRIINASDSQPGAMLEPPTTDSKKSLFAYGAHIHFSHYTIPAKLYQLRYKNWSSVPFGAIVATRAGAVLIKTNHCPFGEECEACGACIWITHGRVPVKAGEPLEPKIPMTEAIKRAGHGSILEGVDEWKQDTFVERPGEWQEVYVRRLDTVAGVAMLVYWNF